MKLLTFDFIEFLKISVTLLSTLVPAIVMLQGTVIDFGSASTIIESIVRKLKESRNDESWSRINEDIIKTTVDLGIDSESKGKRKIHRKWFFDEINLDYYQHPDKFEKLKVQVYYQIIETLLILLQINERLNEDTLQILKEMLVFRHENLLKENYNPQVDNLCKYNNLNNDSVKNELKDFKNI